MKQKVLFFIMVAMTMPGAVHAQNDGWVVVNEDTQEEVAKVKAPKVRKQTREESDAPYLKGKVPEVDGIVTFTHEYDVPGKTAQELYELTYKLVSAMTKEDGQINSRISLKNDNEHSFAARFNEWMVFSEHLLAVDRTEFHYSMVVLCEDGHITLGMNHLSYLYSDGKTYKMEDWKEIKLGGGSAYTAEEWITDKEAINKKGTKLLRFNRKFRISTIDRMNDIFERFNEALTTSEQ